MAIVPDESPTSAPDVDFGANDWLLEEMYEQYTADPSSVDETWAMYFRSHGAPSAGAGDGAAAEKQGPKPGPAAEPPARGGGSTPTAAATQQRPHRRPRRPRPPPSRSPHRPRPVALRRLRNPRQLRRYGLVRRARGARFLLIPRATTIGQTSHSRSQSRPPCGGRWHVLPRTWTSP